MSPQDDRDPPEREKRSWREIDQMRDRPRSSQDRRPRSRAEQARSEASTKQYIKQIDGMFAKGKGGAEGERLVRAMRDAHGTPALDDACRAYRDALGYPESPSLISLFLDAGDAELVLGGLEALRSAREAGALELSRGLLSQLRVLAQGSNDAIAEVAEELIEEV